MRTPPVATSTSPYGPSRVRRAVRPGPGRTARLREGGRPRAHRREARPARLRAVEGRQGGRAVLAVAVGGRVVRAGTSSARHGRRPPRRGVRPARRRARPRSSRTTRTRSRSRAAPATASPGTGCTTAWSRSRAGGGEKMSKSLGNSTTVEDVLQDVAPAGAALRARAPATTARSWSGPTRRCPRPSGVRPDRDLRPQRRPTHGRASSLAAPRPPGTPSRRRSTTTSACRRRSRCCTPASAPATRC
jgi:hypothetical protein